MDRNAQIRAAQERIVAVFQKKPNAAFSSVRANGHLGDGLTCRVRQGDHEAVMDMGKGIGGDGTAPTPGFFIRAGLVGCVAIGIKLAATREGIAIDSIDVDVEMDFDDGDLGHIEAIIRSMTFEERRKPNIIAASRRRRIADGSGTTLADVNRLLKDFDKSRKLMKDMMKKGKRGGPFGGRGMPRMGMN